MTDTAAFTELCPGCFADKGSASLCPHCGYDESLKRGPLLLAHNTLLHHGQYLIGKVLGRPGGFGITYLALDTKLETRVAIKEYLPRDLAGRDAGHATISAHSAEDGEFFRYGLTQFLQEARTLAQFDHANIVRVRNFFEDNGTGYLVMDYYDGVTLADYLAQQPQGRLPEKTAVGILMPILDGLREVHAKNFLHRDIKPQNIYLTTGNRPILLDFGAARQAMSERSRSLSVVLSEGYAPYEQYHRRGEQGPWTDIYACAAVLYHAVAGEPPPPATERMHKDELDIAALGVSKSLADALRMGLAADHHNRPQRMTEFQALLLGGADVRDAESWEQRHVHAPAKVVAPKLVVPTKGKTSPFQKTRFRIALALVIFIAMVAIVNLGKKEKVPDASAHGAVAVTVPAVDSIAISSLPTREVSVPVLNPEVTVKLGHVAPLTGPMAHLGKDNENGARMAIDELNSKGLEIGGAKIKFELLAEDDQADPKQGTIIAQKLVDAKVNGVIGHLNSGTTIPASKIYSDAGIPQISGSATNPKYTQQGFKTAFRVMANDVQQGKMLGEYASQQLHAKSVAIIDDRSAYGQGLANEFKKAMEKAGIEVVATEFTNDRATDFSGILSKIKIMKPDVIFYGGMDEQSGLMSKQIRELNLNARFMTGDGGCTPHFIELAGYAAVGQYCALPGVPLEMMPGGRAFGEKFTSKYGQIQLYAPYVYDAVMVIADAMKRANSVDAAKYLPEIRKKAYQGVTARIRFDDSGDLRGGSVSIYQVKAGRWEYLETIGSGK